MKYPDIFFIHVSGNIRIKTIIISIYLLKMGHEKELHCVKEIAVSFHAVMDIATYMELKYVILIFPFIPIYKMSLLSIISIAQLNSTLPERQLSTDNLWPTTKRLQGLCWIMRLSQKEFWISSSTLLQLNVFVWSPLNSKINCAAFHE